MAGTTRYPGLEVDSRDNGLHLADQESPLFSNDPPPVIDTGTYGDKSWGPAQVNYPKQTWGLQRSILLLSAALAIAVVLAAVAAGVGGSIASKRSQKIQDLQNQLSNLSLANCTQCDNTSSPAANASMDTSSTIDLDHPVSNCSDYHIDVAFRTKRSTNKLFTPDCGQDYVGFDLYSLWTGSFRDCVEACAKWPDGGDGVQPCVAVTFSTFYENDTHGNGYNCYVKSKGANKTPRSTHDSALLVNK